MTITAFKLRYSNPKIVSDIPHIPSITFRVMNWSNLHNSDKWNSDKSKTRRQFLGKIKTKGQQRKSSPPGIDSERCITMVADDRHFYKLVGSRGLHKAVRDGYQESRWNSHHFLFIAISDKWNWDNQKNRGKIKLKD